MSRRNSFGGYQPINPNQKVPVKLNVKVNIPLGWIFITVVIMYFIMKG